MITSKSVAVLLPCLNEEVAIADVIARTRRALPNATIYVYDNGSTDATVECAKVAGAVVRHEPARGKGNVVRRMFADIEADIYVMMDGDGTYEIEVAPEMIQLLEGGQLDLVTGNRVEVSQSLNSYRPGHRLGNKVFTSCLRMIFQSNCEDVLSGYRVMSRRFVKSFPSTSRGFEVEVEMTSHASLLRIPSGEYPTKYVERPPQSFSKLNTYRDGLRIARSLFRIFRAYSPSRFFGSLSVVSALFSLSFFWQNSKSALDHASNGLIVALLLAVLSCLCLFVGVILNSVSRSRTEVLRLAYMAIPR